MKVLLSIKPHFVDKIFDGTKKYEFRRSIFKRAGIKTVIIYASYPIKRIVGEFQIKEIISDEVDKIWERTKEHAGITKDFFEAYYADKKIATVIHIGRITKYKKNKLLSDFNVKQAPQSFCYLNDDDL